MKSARSRAIDVAREIFGLSYSDETIETMAKDQSENGQTLARVLGAVERAIDADRRAAQKALLPS